MQISSASLVILRATADSTWQTEVKGRVRIKFEFHPFATQPYVDVGSNDIFKSM